MHKVIITVLEGDTFRAELHFTDYKDKIQTFSLRPSDAFCLALRNNVPIFVAAHVIERAGVGPEPGSKLQ